jgi:hypothetical protein
VAGCCECGDKPSGSCGTELVSSLFNDDSLVNQAIESVEG